ncbi:hypothetical protein SODALDRAFT_90671 [Sodiomyces alkalinus F11]|uniref:Uncharacterized protein n=1 Tax=Sodiomyces alkalinus (strain CBS 110278 / VKM F-3762 / F11) TaxID=1314773 RepID=A0A3N2Q0A3_SODAK|nr:hypothetical protein SODALDRAFT_90671 [Sodiomyces alkalinus F11]ROT40197.1 hypothetical protein SODALDRAFT_90671 [Sodiomyces alkalinus F11]
MYIRSFSPSLSRTRLLPLSSLSPHGLSLHPLSLTLSLSLSFTQPRESHIIIVHALNIPVVVSHDVQNLEREQPPPRQSAP